ncbi:hypothetical protein BaRGS_00024745 [Batillaria attramentaria]|uniref:Secreted protein n=1 Tax=Batillaria attramentaria TaxID=370345 RepID=A0ABD0KAA7_9CAEN
MCSAGLLCCFYLTGYSIDLVGGKQHKRTVSSDHTWGGDRTRVVTRSGMMMTLRVVCKSRGHRDGLAFHYSQLNNQSFLCARAVLDE